MDPNKEYGMKDHCLGSLKGQFLIAMPNLVEPSFFQTVILVCEHNASGAVGVIINRTHPFLTCRHVFEEIQINCLPHIASNPIHIGGPVHSEEIFILHGAPFEWNGSLSVTPFVSLSNTLDLLNEIGKGSGPQSFIVALGCAGWAPGQLESELSQNVWLTTPAYEKTIFDTAVNDRWESALRHMGVDPLWLSSQAGHA
jgi:putative transcriptional regulator